MDMQTLPKTHKCHECGKAIDHEEALCLYKRIGDLKQGFYYCKECVDREIDRGKHK